MRQQRSQRRSSSTHPRSPLKNRLPSRRTKTVSSRGAHTRGAASRDAPSPAVGSGADNTEVMRSLARSMSAMADLASGGDDRTLTAVRGLASAMEMLTRSAEPPVRHRLQPQTTAWGGSGSGQNGLSPLVSPLSAVPTTPVTLSDAASTNLVTSTGRFVFDSPEAAAATPPPAELTAAKPLPPVTDGGGGGGGDGKEGASSGVSETDPEIEDLEEEEGEGEGEGDDDDHHVEEGDVDEEDGNDDEASTMRVTTTTTAPTLSQPPRTPTRSTRRSPSKRSKSRSSSKSRSRRVGAAAGSGSTGSPSTRRKQSSDFRRIMCCGTEGAGRRSPSPFSAAGGPFDDALNPPLSPMRTRVATSGGRDLVMTVDDTDIRCATAVNAHVWTGNRSGGIVVRHVETGVEVDRVDTGEWSVSCLAHVGSAVWAGTNSGSVLVFDASTREMIRELHQHTGGVLSIGFDPVMEPSETAVFTGSNDFTVQMWTASGGVAKTFTGHGNGVRSVLVIGPHLWTASDDQTIRVWHILTGKCLKVLRGHTGSVTSLVSAVSKVDPVVCGTRSGLRTVVWSVSADRTLRAWDVTGDRPCIRVATVDHQVHTLTNVGPEIWSCGSSDGLILRWDPHSMSIKQKLHAHTRFVSSIIRAKRTDSMWLHTHSLQDKVLNVWHLKSNPFSSARDPDELLMNVQAVSAIAVDEIAHVHGVLKTSMASNDELQAKLGDVTSTLRRTDAALEAERAENTRNVARIKELERMYAVESKSAASLQATVGTLEDKMSATATSAETALQEALGQVRDRENELRAVHRRLVALQNAKEEQLTHRAEVEKELHHKLAESRVQLGVMEDAMFAVARKLTDVTHQRDATEFSTSTVYKDMENLHESYERLKTQLAEDTSTKAWLRDKLQALGVDMARASKTLDEEKAVTYNLATALAEAESAKGFAEQETARWAQMLASLEDSTAREQRLRERFDKLNMYRWDLAGREMMELDLRVARCRTAVTSFDLEVVSDMTQRTAVGGLLATMNDLLADCRDRLKATVAQCLTPTQKLHVGARMKPVNKLPPPYNHKIAGGGGNSPVRAGSPASLRRGGQSRRLMGSRRPRPASATVRREDRLRPGESSGVATFPSSDNALLASLGSV